MTGSLRRDHKFAKALTAAMKRSKKSRADVATAIGVARSTVQGWLNGSEPGDDNFRKLVALFPELARFES
jgi:transcriptional regulator with XRE-family HTH domain